MNQYPKTLKEAIKEIDELSCIMAMLEGRINELYIENEILKEIKESIKKLVEEDTDNLLPF